MTAQSSQVLMKRVLFVVSRVRSPGTMIDIFMQYRVVRSNWRPSRYLQVKSQKWEHTFVSLQTNLIHQLLDQLLHVHACRSSLSQMSFTNACVEL
jgi:hypothetical protein